MYASEAGTFCPEEGQKFLCLFCATLIFSKRKGKAHKSRLVRKLGCDVYLCFDEKERPKKKGNGAEKDVV